MRKLLLSLLALIFTVQMQAQTGISAAGTAPDASAMLDVIATDKGFLAPRVALVATNNSLLPIASPADGLLVYNTGLGGVATKGFYYWDATNSTWQKVVTGNGTFPTGSGSNGYVTYWTGTSTQSYDNSTAGHFFWDATNDRLGIGTNTPSARLNIVGPAYAQTAITWPDYDPDQNTNSVISYRSESGGNGTISTAGTGPTDVLYLAGNYYDSRAVITIPGSGGASPADQGTGSGKDLMLLGGRSDNGNGLIGGRLLVQGGSGYSGGAYGSNYGAVALQSLGGNVGIGTTTPVAKLELEGTSANWTEATPGLATGSIHLDPGSPTDHFGSAITWGASDASNGDNAQAGIYTRSDGSYGTKMYFATTDAYVTGSKTRMYIGADGT